MRKPLRSTAKIAQVGVTMKTVVRLTVGDMLLYPYSNEVAAGEPSSVKKFHAAHSDQECRVVGLRHADNTSVFSRLGGGSRSATLMVKVRFADGAEIELIPEAFIYIGKKKAARKEEEGGRPIA